MGVGRIPVFLAAAAVAGATAGEARASLFFLLDPTAAKPGDVVTVRTGGTPKSFTLRQRVRPLQRPIRLYLVPSRLAPDVHNRFDRRAHFIGRLVPDRNERGLLRFTVPPLDTDSYTVGAWCPGCARYSRGHTWFVTEVKAPDVVPRYRRLMLLRVTAPPAEPCPTTRPNNGLWHRNDLLAARLGTSVFGLAEKQIWRPVQVGGAPTVRYRRLDVPGAVLTAETVSGDDGSWAARLRFPEEGCWLITGRVDDVALSFVVKVVAKPLG
jgi:hypothetical protein